MFYRQLFLSTFVIFLCFSSIVCAASHLYVDSSNGDDGWDGSSPAYQSGSIGPKKTLTAARDTVRQWISSGLSGDVYVELRGGRYELASTLTFNNQDDHPIYYIIWRNYNGEDVRISGGKQITGGWSWDAAKGCYKTYIPEVASGSWWFRDLYRNDRRLIRARWPNAPTDTMKQAWATSVRMPSDANLLTITSVNTEKTQISFNTAPPQPLGVSDKAEAVVFYLWTTMRTVIDHNSGSTVYLADAMDGCLAIQPGNEYARKGFLENSYTFIDKNDEWALDTAGYLYYLGQDPNGQVFMAPRIDNLILVQGSSVGDRVRNLHFVGLTFEHGNFKFPNGGLDWNPRQAGVPCNYVHIPAAVRFAYTTNCSLQDCNVVRSSGVGVHLDKGSWWDRVERCTVADIGNSGIILGNAAEETVSPTRTAYGRVENNIIYKCGLGDFSSLGVGEIFMHGASICHNEIYDLPNTGISLGWHWWGSTVNVNAQNITVEYNYIHNVCQFMDDGGAIYTLDDLTNSSISHNLIGRVGWDGQTCSGFYADEGSSRFKFFGNVIDTIYRGWCCFLHFETNDAQVRNNIFIDGQWREFYVSHKQGFTGYFMNFSNNIVCQKTNADSWLTFTKGFDNPSQYDVDLNCYYNPSNPTKVFAGYSWDYWRNTLGNDSNSYYQQDPMFEDGNHADKNYQLRPESPLLASPMNFQQVKVKDAGVQPSKADVENRAYSDIAVSGTLSGSYLQSHKSDNNYEQITEILSGGTNRYSYLEHKWVIRVTGGDTVTFFVEAYKTANTENDNFVFAYSTDNSVYTDMVTVVKTSDDNLYQSYVLPSSLSGMVYIRVKDTDRTGGKGTLDKLYVDSMYILCGFDRIPPAAPAGLGATAGDSSVSLDWDDNTESDLAGYNIYRSTTSGSNYSQIVSRVGNSAYIDNTAVNTLSYYYLVTAVDIKGNESVFSNQVTAEPHIPADIKIDGSVDLFDFAVLANSWLDSYSFETLQEIADAWLTNTLP